MSSYKVSIVTPNGKMFEDDVTALIAPGSEGFFGVLANHAPMVTALKQGVVQITQESKKIFFSITSGVLEVDQKNEVMLLCDDAIEASTLEEAKDKLIAVESAQTSNSAV